MKTRSNDKNIVIVLMLLALFAVLASNYAVAEKGDATIISCPEMLYVIPAEPTSIQIEVDGVKETVERRSNDSVTGAIINVGWFHPHASNDAWPLPLVEVNVQGSYVKCFYDGSPGYVMRYLIMKALPEDHNCSVKYPDSVRCWPRSVK